MLINDLHQITYMVAYYFIIQNIYAIKTIMLPMYICVLHKVTNKAISLRFTDTNLFIICSADLNNRIITFAYRMMVLLRKGTHKNIHRIPKWLTLYLHTTSKIGYYQQTHFKFWQPLQVGQLLFSMGLLSFNIRTSFQVEFEFKFAILKAYTKSC